MPDLTGEPVPRELMLRLRHMILSHHGEMNYGSPKVPMTPEAMFLHLIDLLDTRMHMVLRELREDRNNPSALDALQRNLGRRFYKGGAHWAICIRRAAEDTTETESRNAGSSKFEKKQRRPA